MLAIEFGIVRYFWVVSNIIKKKKKKKKKKKNCYFKGLHKIIKTNIYIYITI
jgi:hypothetical protein